MGSWAAPLNFSKYWNYTDISPIFWNLPTFLRCDKPKHWLELVPSRLLSISCPDDLQMLNSRRSCLTSPIVTDGRIYIPSTVSSGDEYILLLHSKYRTEISTKHFCLSAPVTIWQEQARSRAERQARVLLWGCSCHPHHPHTRGARCGALPRAPPTPWPSSGSRDRPSAPAPCPKGKLAAWQ